MQPLIGRKDDVHHYDRVEENKAAYKEGTEQDKEKEIKNIQTQKEEEKRSILNVKLPTLRMRNMKQRKSVVAAMLPSLSLVPSKASQVESKVSKIIEEQKQQQSNN